jgi:hypothetical protein
MIRTGIFFLAISAFAPAAPLRLVNGGTTITLEPGVTAPRLSRLAQWDNRAPEVLIDHVETNGVTQSLKWRSKPSGTIATQTFVRFLYECSKPHLRLYWEWHVRAAPGPIEHTIRIQNLSEAEVWLPLQDSLRFDFQIPPNLQLAQFWVEKGASSPSAEGTHIVPIQDGFEWVGTSSTYAHAGKSTIREMIPYLLIQRPGPEPTSWYTGIEFSGRTHITLQRHGDSLTGEAGLNPNPGPYRTRLPAGGTFETPTIFLGTFKGDPDDAGNNLRRWIRAALNNPLTLRNAQYPLLVSNSWGSGMAINEQQAHRMIDDASALGLEMFHLDAGWFRAVGDWVSNPDKFPRGVASVADYAHKRGLRFGLWTDWTQAGVSTYPGALNVYDSKTHDWLTTSPPTDWKPEEFKGITIDIGLPAARDWAAARVATVIRDLHIDMLEHDGYLVAEGCERNSHPHAPLDPAEARHYKDEGSFWVEGSNDTDVSDHATRAYYQIQTKLRRQFPGLLFEICNDGGRMVDFGSAAHGDYFSITDAYDPLSNRRAFFDASYVLPPAMLETYVEKWPTPRIESFRYMLRSGMMGWFTLMLDSNTWTPPQHAAARAEFTLYKQKLRPLIRQANLYHVSPRPTEAHWDGIEYFDAATGCGVLFAFHGTDPAETSHHFPIRGLLLKKTYRVTFQDHTSEDYTASGERLAQSGITVHSPIPNSSELVFLNTVEH